MADGDDAGRAAVELAHQLIVHYGEDGQAQWFSAARTAICNDPDFGALVLSALSGAAVKALLALTELKPEVSEAGQSQ